MVKVVVSDPESGSAYQMDLEDSRVNRLRGIKTGKKFEGEIIGLSGYELKVTGGTDKDGFPIRPDVDGPGRSRVLLAKGPGFKPSRRGERRRKSVRGKVISSDIVQLNVKVVKSGEKPLEQIISPETIEPAE